MGDGRHLEAVIKEPVDAASGHFEVHLYDGDDRLGFALGEHESDEEMLLVYLFVFERHRQQGLGEALLDHFEEVALQIGYAKIQGVVTWPTPDIPDEDACRARAGWFLRRGYRVRRRFDDWTIDRFLR